jgi:glycosyltransferase involved in cell wall biosynthesis
MYKSKKVSVVIPTYNEAESIKGIIERFFATNLVDEVVAVDNNALGNTKEEILKTKAKYVRETKQGYGFALMRGLLESSGDLIVMCEADGTADPEDIHKFLLYSDDFPVVLSTRTSRASIWSGAFMPFPVRFGNWFWAKVVEVLYNGPGLTDIGCTYKLISKEALSKIKDLFVMSDGDGKFSPEFIIWVLRRKIKLIEIPVMFRPRIGKSMYTGSVLKAAKLGFFEMIMIIRYLFKKI